jgi:hypothetical protein
MCDRIAEVTCYGWILRDFPKKKVNGSFVNVNVIVIVIVIITLPLRLSASGQRINK